MDLLVNTCRFCLIPRQADISIFEPTETQGYLYEKVNSCFRFQISKDDGLPEKICKECFKSLEFVLNFWNMICDSEKQLFAMLKNIGKLHETEFTKDSEPMYETVMLKDVDVVINGKECSELRSNDCSPESDSQLNSTIISASETYQNTETRILNRESQDANIGKRKQGRNPENWTRNLRKYLRNAGLPYTDWKNRIVPGKVFQNKNCQCRRNCRMPAKEREKLFQSFWKLQDYNKQNIFLRELLQTSATLRGRPKDRSRTPKSKSVKYFLRLENKSTVQVCKTFFLDTFVISQKRIYKVLGKKGDAELMDKRGRKSPHNKIDDSAVREHIQSVINYCDGNQKNQNLSVASMYRLYEEWCAGSAIKPVKMSYYYKVYNVHFKSDHKE